MKKIAMLIACFIGMNFSSSFAESQPIHNFALGITISYIQYKEPGVMKEWGPMYGICGSYAYHNKLMLKAEGRAAFGIIDYKGTGTIRDINDYFTEVRGLGGYDFAVSDASSLTPYIGAGYRYLNDDLSGKISSTGAVGYERESRYLYSPVGIEAVTHLKDNWSLGASGEYDILWRGRQDSHLSEVAGLQDSKNRQKKGYGMRGTVKLVKQHKSLDFIIEPFIIYWNIKESVHSTQAVEPKNHSTEFGITLAIGF